MSAYGRGDISAAQELFVRFGPKVFSIGLHTLHDVDLASAFVEQTFVRMWQLASRFSTSSLPLDSWVVRQALAVAFGTHWDDDVRSLSARCLSSSVFVAEVVESTWVSASEGSR